ncbi:MAG: transposase [Acidiferrobacteraceae bacterium]
MEKLPKQVYTPEYRAQAVRLVTEQKKTVPQAARELGMSVKT